MTIKPQNPQANSMPDNADLSKVIELPINSLRGFEVVEQQFADLGVLFENTVVLQPSNAAYFPVVGKMVLMGAPRNGWIEIRFTVPIIYFYCRLTSSQQASVNAYNTCGQEIFTVETTAIEHQDSDPLVSSPPPNLPIAIQAANIQRVTLNSIDGQLVIHDIRFGC